MSEKNNTIAQLEAMLFAAGDPVEPEKLADVLKLDIENVIKMLGYLEAKYDENGSGLRLIRVDGKYQICTREAYADGVRALLEIKKNTPLSPAAFEVLAIVAYNKAVTRSFVEQVRGVDCSGPISGLVQKGLNQRRRNHFSQWKPRQPTCAPYITKCNSSSALISQMYRLIAAEIVACPAS